MTDSLAGVLPVFSPNACYAGYQLNLSGVVWNFPEVSLEVSLGSLELYESQSKFSGVSLVANQTASFLVASCWVMLFKKYM